MRLDQLEIRLRAARADRARVLSGLMRGVPAAFGRVFAGWARRAERSAAMRELHMLDDGMLKDIGLYRGEIWYAADAASRGVDVRKPVAPPVTRPILRPLPCDSTPPANDNHGYPAPAIMGAGRA